MATTVTIDEKAAEIARSLAEIHGTSIDDAVTYLIIQHGAQNELHSRLRGFEPLPKPPGSPVLTSEMVYAALDDDDR